MQRVRLTSVNDFDEWRLAARGLLLRGTPPDEVAWEDPNAGIDLFSDPEERPPDVASRAVGVVPPKFLEVAEAALCHRDPVRFGLCYRVLFRLQKDRALIGVRADPDISKLYRLAGEVSRDSHKMKAFVRFREDETRFAAWFEPDHYTLERTAPFFVRRFAGMAWAILTPYRSAAWDGETLVFGGGTRRQDAPSGDAMEDVWRTYFRSIFNPARLKVAMMKSEMPVKYWRNLPEAELIAPLIRGARQAEETMIARPATQPPLRHERAAARRVEPEEPVDIASLADARAAAAGCTRCPLHEYATQTVFGEGPQTAEVMFVGEQPGDQEDLAGRPFVGPAGQVFDATLDKIGIDRSRVYVTNAVKHFKFEPRGKKRIHSKPNAGEIAACRFWLDLERGFVRPKLVVALGASAAASLLGKTTAVSAVRGRKLELPDGATLMVTVHPSYLLRIPEAERRAEEHKKFEADLRAVKAFIDRRGDDVRRGGHIAA